MAQTIVSQVRNHPDAVMELALSNLPKLSMDASFFGEFVQQMSELGLIFDITFTDEQLLKLPDWTLVDEKITLCLLCIYPTVHLPKPPSSTTGSVNGTVWSFVKVKSSTVNVRAHFSGPLFQLYLHQLHTCFTYVSPSSRFMPTSRSRKDNVFHC